MNRKNEKQILLNDLFGAGPSASASATLAIVRRGARRRRWNRYFRTGACAVGVLLLPALFALRNTRLQHPPAGSLPLASLPVVEVVTSQSLPNLVVTTMPNSVATVATLPTAAADDLIVTTRQPGPEAIDDTTLLDLAPGALLVHYSKESVALILPESRAASE